MMGITTGLKVWRPCVRQRPIARGDVETKKLQDNAVAEGG